MDAAIVTATVTVLSKFAVDLVKFHSTFSHIRMITRKCGYAKKVDVNWKFPTPSQKLQIPNIKQLLHLKLCL
jgi:hypothetical protein